MGIRMPSTFPIRASQKWCARPICRTPICANMRSNSLETTGNIMAVAYETSKKDLQPAGFELFDISKPENPKAIGFFDCSGPHSRGVISSGSATANMCIARRARAISRRPIRRTTSSIAASTCAIRRSRSRSAAGGCQAHGKATTSFRRRAIRSTRVSAPTTPMSIRSTATAVTSPISTAACLCSIAGKTTLVRRFLGSPEAAQSSTRI